MFKNENINHGKHGNKGQGHSFSVLSVLYVVNNVSI